MAGKEIAVKKYVVKLGAEERERLKALVHSGKSPFHSVRPPAVSSTPIDQMLRNGLASSIRTPISLGMYRLRETSAPSRSRTSQRAS